MIISATGKHTSTAFGEVAFPVFISSTNIKYKLWIDTYFLKRVKRVV